MRSEQERLLYKQIEEIPSRPGVYKFHDNAGIVLYVGKAKNLRSRVGSYFTSKHYDRPNIIPMIDQIVKIETIETENEIEALVLESALIKEYTPKYNVLMKDDKSYAWIYISTREELPTVKVVRSINRDDYRQGRLFGPYPNSRATRQIYRYIRKMVPFCTCNNPKEPCLYYHIGLCNNPKFGETTITDYKEGINEIIKFLEGNRRRHVNKLRDQMVKLSEDQKYEEAALLRDRIEDLEHLGNRVNAYEDESDYIVKKKLNRKKDLESISKDLGVDVELNRIECYDISNTQGKQSYGSMVVLEDGRLESSQYRVFKIKGKDDPDDYQMLNEVLDRRLRHVGVSSDDSLSKLPDLILIDGGKGQVNAVKALIPDEIVLLGISKGRSMKKKKKKSKDQFWLDNGDKIKEVRISEPRLLIRLRDEAHRFALKHHRLARMKQKNISLFDKVEGIGQKRKKQLLKSFGSIDGIRKADVDEINKVIKNRSVSNRLKEALEK